MKPFQQEENGDSTANAAWTRNNYGVIMTKFLGCVK